MIHTRFEVTILEPLIEIEALGLVFMAEAKGWIAQVNQSGRILILEGPKTVKPIIKFLAEGGFGEDVGLIRMIKDYEPDEYEKEFMEYNRDDEL